MPAFSIKKIPTNKQKNLQLVQCFFKCKQRRKTTSCLLSPKNSFHTSTRSSDSKEHGFSWMDSKAFRSRNRAVCRKCYPPSPPSPSSVDLQGILLSTHAQVNQTAKTSLLHSLRPWLTRLFYQDILHFFVCLFVSVILCDFMWGRRWGHL